MATEKSIITCPTCKSKKPMGTMEDHCCSTCKNWEPLKKENLGVCLQRNTGEFLKYSHIVHSFFGCVNHSNALRLMPKN
jgi:hypothetical protein